MIIMIFGAINDQPNAERKMHVTEILVEEDDVVDVWGISDVPRDIHCNRVLTDGDFGP